MTKAIAKDIRCILMRAGIELWLEKDRMDNFIALLKSQKQSTFVEIDDQLINTADVVGVFTPEKMEEKTRMKNGQWKCTFGNWHEKGQKHDCDDYRYDSDGNKIAKFIYGEGWRKLN